MANHLGEVVKKVVSSAPGHDDPWSASYGSSDPSCTLALGRFSITATTAVIAHPGTPGNQAFELRQATHIQDVYDYAFGTGEYPGLNHAAVNNAYSGMLLGIAKPFEMYGSTSDYAEQGVR